MACTERIPIAETPSGERARRMARARLAEALLRLSTVSLGGDAVRTVLEELVADLLSDLEELAPVEGAKNG
jgi:hypothetical protein